MTKPDAFTKEWEKRIKSVDRVIVRFLPKETGSAGTPPGMRDVAMPLTVAEAMNYSVRAGGKRLRPLLAQLTFELFHGTNKKLLHPFLAALEMIHTYSLVHDDLPAMDNDTLRRGKPTTHAVYGEAMAILAGDGLLNYAYETALSATEHCTGENDLLYAVLALRILSHKAGIGGMVGGQCVDIETEKQPPENAAEALYFIQENKTAALIEASLMCGAILAGARVEAVDLLERAGSLIGRAFQITDDLLDVTAEAEVLGKTPGKDAANGKLTYVSLFGKEQAERDAEAYTAEALKMLDAVGARQEDFLVRLLEHLTARTH